MGFYISYTRPTFCPPASWQFVYCNSAFEPSPDQSLADLFKVSRFFHLAVRAQYPSGCNFLLDPAKVEGLKHFLPRDSHSWVYGDFTI